MSDKRIEDRWQNVSLRIFGDNLPEADEIKSVLQLPAKSSGRKGRHIRDNPRYARHTTNFWLWQFTTDSNARFDVQISQLLDILEPKATELQKLLALPGIEAQLVLGYGSESGQGGGYLPALLVARISALSLALYIDLYPPSECKPDAEARLK